MININVVGSIIDKEQLNEIETIAKVFVVAERINDLTYNLKPENIISNPPKISQRKAKNLKYSYNKKLLLINVRGFN